MAYAITELLNTIEIVTGGPQLLFMVCTTSFSLKTGLLIYLARRTLQAKTTPLPIHFLMLVLLSSLLCDISWILTPFQSLIDFRIYNTFVRISWAFTILFYQALTFFIESLTQQHSTITLRQKFFLTISLLFFSFYIGIAVIDFNCASYENKYWIEKKMFSPVSIFFIFSLMLSCVIIFKKLRTNCTPRILTKQIKLFMLGIILPLFISDCIQVASLIISPLKYWINSNYTFANLSNILLIYAIFYSMRRIIGLRFLNLKSKIQSPINFSFMDNFKIILERLSRVTNQNELNHVAQEFFKDAFDIPFSKINLYIRAEQATDHKTTYMQPHSQTVSFIETFLATHTEDVCKEIYTHKIMIYDEIAFSNFYDQHEARTNIMHFLHNINADIFLPIYEKENLIAYIVVERSARINSFYSEVEHNEMLIFANYLGNIINLLNKQNLDLLIEQEKALSEELYRKHQEINQYKESIRSFLRASHQKTIGIVFYKNRLFTFGNQAAKEMIKINLNMQQGHPIARAFKHLAQQVEEYKAPQIGKASDSDGNVLMLSGVPNLENNNSIITVSYPDISDILKHHIDKLNDPSERDYLLYLETTKSGKLINQLIPGSGETLLNFKIELLKTALSKNATLLTMPEQDLQSTVELLHHISLRETLHTINLIGPSKNLDVGIALFGINPIFGLTRYDRPLCEQFNDTGTLFIKNIHYLDLETQKHLAELIRYGLYRAFKGEQKETSNVRIICSSDQNLSLLVQEGHFSHDLFNQLKETSLIMPPLTTLSEEELGSLAEGFTEQALKSSTFKNLLTLTSKDKNKLTSQRPASLSELKNRVQHIIEYKSQQHEIHTETQFNSAYHAHNPELVDVARLGKQALKNKEAMTLLWNTFQNQNQIAAFLGVNRSSVNRRCKAYNLTLP